MKSDRELLELAAIGKLAVAEHTAWLVRNLERNKVRDFLNEYRENTGEWYVDEEAEPEDRTLFSSLSASLKMTQGKLATARAATRRAIVRAAAEIGET